MTHTVFAVIIGEEIINLIIGDYYNCSIVTELQYGKDAFIEDVTDYPVQIGDKYRDGKFYRWNPSTGMEDEIPRVKRPDEIINELQDKVLRMTSTISKQDDIITNLELALTSMYEKENK